MIDLSKGYNYLILVRICEIIFGKVCLASAKLIDAPDDRQDHHSIGAAHQRGKSVLSSTSKIFKSKLCTRD